MLNKKIFSFFLVLILGCFVSNTLYSNGHNVRKAAGVAGLGISVTGACMGNPALIAAGIVTAFCGINADILLDRVMNLTRQALPKTGFAGLLDDAKSFGTDLKHATAGRVADFARTKRDESIMQEAFEHGNIVHIASAMLNASYNGIRAVTRKMLFLS